MKSLVGGLFCWVSFAMALSEESSDENVRARLLSKKTSRLDPRDFEIPQSWGDVQQMDPIAILVFVLVIWILCCLACNMIRCLFSALCSCFQYWCCTSRRRRVDYVSINDATRDPPYNPLYHQTQYRSVPRGSDGDSCCRNTLWALCCFECCCRDNKDVECCDICCGLCLYEMCCPRR